MFFFHIYLPSYSASDSASVRIIYTRHLLQQLSSMLLRNSTREMDKVVKGKQDKGEEGYQTHTCIPLDDFLICHFRPVALGGACDSMPPLDTSARIWLGEGPGITAAVTKSTRFQNSQNILPRAPLKTYCHVLHSLRESGLTNLSDRASPVAYSALRQKMCSYNMRSTKKTPQ